MTISSQTQRRWGGSQSHWKATPRFTAPIQPGPGKKNADESAPAQVQSAPTRPLAPQIRNQHPQTPPHLTSEARSTTLDRYIGDARSHVPSDFQISREQLWGCVCGYYNKRKDQWCRGCRAPKGRTTRRSEDPIIAQEWKHVKPIIESSEQKSEPVKQTTRSTEAVVDNNLEIERQQRLVDSKRKRFVELEPHFRKPSLNFQDVPRQPQPGFEPPKIVAVDGPQTRIRKREDVRKGDQSNEPGKSTQPTLPTESLPRSASAKPLSDNLTALQGRPEPTASTFSQPKSGWKKWDPLQARPTPEPSQSVLLQTNTSQEPIEADGTKFNVDEEKPVQKNQGVRRWRSSHSDNGSVTDDNKITQPRSTGSDLAKAALSRDTQPVRKDSSELNLVSDDNKTTQPRSTANDLTKAALPRHDEPIRKDASEDNLVSDGYELMQSHSKPDLSSRTTASQYDQPETKADVMSSSNGLNKKPWRAWRPVQLESNGVSNEPRQPGSIPNKSIASPSPEADRSETGNSVTPLTKSSGANVWKRWRPALNAKADSTGNDELNDSKSASTYDDGRFSTEEHTHESPANESPANESPAGESPANESSLYVSLDEMKVTEDQATVNRMAQRRQQLDEESGYEFKKRGQPQRFDPHRERRTSIIGKRKLIESEAEASDYDDDDADHIRHRRKKQRKQQLVAEKLQSSPTPIYLPGFISVANLAGALRIKIEDFTRKMKQLGFDETNNDHVLDAETAGLIAAEFNFEAIVEQADNQDLMPRPPAEDKTLLPSRPPVVTIMGHVDHGKTTLLDWLRKSSVAASEYGGITQHIGAFSVVMPSGRTITFLDTPGHAAFLEMRQRGANVTDIVILVVAADDSVKPQTVEAIKHAQAANVPMIVAVNKIDKEEADVDKVKQDLARYGVEIEDYGGDTQVVCVSGKSGQGMETLEESVVALADILDMRAETDGLAEGWVLEATTKKAGRVATVLVRRGTLYPGDILVAGTTWTRIRSLHNEAGVQVESASPGMPVEIDGWRDQPAAGDEALQADDEQHARSVVDIRLQVAEHAQMATDVSAVNEARKQEQERRRLAEIADEAAAKGTISPPKENRDETPGFKNVPLVIKADVSGSVEAILTSVLALGNNFVRASILRSGVGTISEFDVAHAASAQGHIFAFNIAVEPHIRRAAETSGVKIFEHNVIYRLVDSVKGVLEDYLEPLRTKRVLGEAEVSQVFEINVKGRQFVPVAGCKVRNGVVGRKKRVLVKRGDEIVFDGKPTCVANLLSCFFLCNTRE